MRIKHIQTWLMILASALPLLANTQVPQEDPGDEPYMKLVLENNPTLRAAREYYQLALLEAGTGNTPPNPEVEFGYLFGNPSQLGRRLDFSVSQEVDFPTTYIHRSRARKIRNSQSELEYLLARQEVLLLARQVMIERIYLNSQQALLGDRLLHARTIHEGFQQKVAAGEENQLSLNQSQLHLVSLEGEFEQNRAMILNNKLSIKELTGGSNMEIHEAYLPPPTFIIKDSIVNAYLQSPELLLY